MPTKQPVKIAALEIENLKRVKAVQIDCSGKALTVIGGRNRQGKTSVLDAIMWALGGDRFRPSAPVKDGTEKAYVKVDLDNGITVERKGVNAALKVTSAEGKGGQALLNEFVNLFALDLPRFMQATPTEKAQMLLDTMPDLGPALQRLNQEAERLYRERHSLGQIADRKAKYANELPYCSDAPDEPLSGADMTAKMRDALAKNASNRAARQNVERLAERAEGLRMRRDQVAKRVGDLQAALQDAEAQLQDAQREHAEAVSAHEASRKSAEALRDEDTTAIEVALEEIDAVNAKVRTNESKRNAEAEASELKEQYQQLTNELEAVRDQRIRLLAGVEMPLPGLSIAEDGTLTYEGQAWDCMSGSEQLQVATAICAAMKPACGFVLLDKLESMDTDTLREFAVWLASRNLQAIGTRVGTGAENTIVIEDGAVAGAAAEPEAGEKLRF